MADILVADDDADLSDVLMPDLGRKRIPVLLTSGRVDLPKIAARVGTPYFVPKPCRLEHLWVTLEKAPTERTPSTPSLLEPGS